MSLGATIAGRHTDYSPSRKPIVSRLEGGKEPARFDETVERSEETRDDRRERHAFAKSRPSSINTCASESDEADYETSSEGPSRLVEGKSSHTRFLSKSHSGNLRKEEATESSKKFPNMEEKSKSKRYVYVREDDKDDTAIGSVSLPILRSIESTDITQIKDRMISDSSFARQQKLRMIVEQTEFLLSTESKIGATTETPEVGCCLAKDYELRRHESLMLLPVIQDIKPTNSTKGTMSSEMEKTIKPFDRGPNSFHYHGNKTSHDLINIAENPESSYTSFYLPPYPVNCTRLDRVNDSPSSTSATSKTTRRRVSNDADVLLKIHGELSPLRCELGQIAAKFRALEFQRMPDPFENSMKKSPILSGYNSNASGYALLRPTDIDRSGGWHNTRYCLVGNSKTQFSPIAMVGKSNSRESCSQLSSIGTTTRLLPAKTGFHRDHHHRSYRESNDPTYFQIASGHDSSIATEYHGERIANSRPSSSFGDYRPRSSCVHDRYNENQDRRGIVRSSDGRPYETSFRFKNSYDTDESRYISRTSTEERPDLLILPSSKEVVREEDRHTPSCRDRRRSRENLTNTLMANVLNENSLVGDKEPASTISLCKDRRPSRLDAHVGCSEEHRSIRGMENVELVDAKTSMNSLGIRESRLILKNHHHHHHHHRHENQQRHRHQQTMILNRSSETSTRATELKEKSNVSSTSGDRMRVISVPKSLEKVKIVPVLFTAGIPEPLLPFFRLDDPARPGNPGERSGQRMITLRRRNSRRISGPSSGKRGPFESDTSGSYVTAPLVLPRDYFSENERWRGNTNTASRMSISKKTSSPNALKYTSELGRVCSGVARVIVSGSTVTDPQRKRQIRKTSPEKGIRGMRSSPEDFFCDT